MPKRSIGIVGSGSVGLAMAAEYSLLGYPVILSEVEGFSERLPASGNITIKGLTFTDHKIGCEHPAKVVTTTDFHDFNTYGCSVVFVVTTAHPHERLLPRLNAVLNPNIPMIVVCGNGSVPAWIDGDRPVTETNTAPYGVRVAKRDENGVELSCKILTPRFGVAGKKEYQQEALEILHLAYPEAFAYSHPLDALLSNPNPLMHVSIMLANLTRLDRKQSFTFYDEGVGESVMRIIKQKDNERMTIANAAGLTPTAFDDFEGVLPMQGMLIIQHFLECGNLAQILAPQSPNDRYFTEDVPYGLIAWEEIAKRVGVVTPIITSEINMVSVILEDNYRFLSADRNTRLLRAL